METLPCYREILPHLDVTRIVPKRVFEVADCLDQESLGHQQIYQFVIGVGLELGPG